MSGESNNRINELIKRAGSPVMIVKGDSKTAEQHIREIKEEVERYEDQHYGEWMTEEHCLEYVLEQEVKKLFNKNNEFVNTIDRLEVALSNVLNERDQLLKDIKFIVNIANGCCWLCKYDGEDGYPEPCRECDDDKDNWTWRGVPDNT